MLEDRKSKPRRRTRRSEIPAVPLAPAERRRRIREFWIGLVLVAALGGLILAQPISGLTKGVGDSGLFLFLNAVTVILILIFGFLVTRNFWKLVGERRRGILGSHLNLKFVSAFVLIALVTTSGLFIVSAFFITQSLDKWFSVQVDRALEESGEVAESYYDSTAQNALFYGARIAERITSEGLMRDGALHDLEALVQAKQREYNLGVVEIFSATGKDLVSAINPDIPAANFSRHDSEFVREAIAGGASWRVDEVGSGDVIRGAVPIDSSLRPGETVGAVVVNVLIPFSQARKVASIRRTLDEYRKLQPTAGHIRSAYLLELLLAATVVLMLALWMGFRLAKGVTGPIRALAEGTAEVARGNLDVSVDASSDDEVGFLVDSFNRMIRDMRSARTNLERSATELERRRRYMEIVLGNIGAGVVSVDAEQRISTINPSAQRYLGIPAGTGLLGQRLADVAMRPELVAEIEEISRQLRPGLRESNRRQVQVPLGDDVATLFVTCTVMHDEAGEALGTVVVFDDYTQLVKVQRMAAWREVARRIAHEIKNPLTPIQLSAQRLRRRFRARFEGDAEACRIFDECVDAITSQVESLKLLVDEFSNFARLPTSNPRPDDLNRIVSEAMASYAGTEDVEFYTELESGLPTVDVDREQIRRALTNLIDNAIAAVRSGNDNGRCGCIRLRSAHDAALQSVRLEIADDGVGIPPENRRRVFEPYFSTKERGTGLGLAIVSRIVADHHGYIRVQENQPRGTRVVLELPVHRMDVERTRGTERDASFPRAEGTA
jgi:two-component system, NtrC family, nitrogen regulation sensor histidine kinase NtrY